MSFANEISVANATPDPKRRVPARWRPSKLIVSWLIVWLGANVGLWFAPEIQTAVRRRAVASALADEMTPYALRFWPLAQGDRDASMTPETAELGLPYLIYDPPRARDQRLPLLLVLHGSGDRADDLQRRPRVLRPTLTSAAWQRRHRCVIAAPVCPARGSWNTPLAASVAGLVAQLIRSHHIDSSRVYVAGHSMGGFGCFAAVAAAPDVFAGGLPVSGGGHGSEVSGARDTPFWLVHGSDDDVVPSSCSRDMAAALRDAGGEARLTLLTGIGHDGWKCVFEDPAYFDWLFDQRRVVRNSSRSDSSAGVHAD